MELPDPPAPDVILDFAAGALTDSLGVVNSVVSSLFSGVVSIFFMIQIEIRISIDADKLQKGLINITPNPYKSEVDSLIVRINTP